MHVYSAPSAEQCLQDLQSNFSHPFSLHVPRKYWLLSKVKTWKQQQQQQQQQQEDIIVQYMDLCLHLNACRAIMVPRILRPPRRPCQPGSDGKPLWWIHGGGNFWGWNVNFLHLDMWKWSLWFNFKRYVRIYTQLRIKASSTCPQTDFKKVVRKRIGTKRKLVAMGGGIVKIECSMNCYKTPAGERMHNTRAGRYMFWLFDTLITRKRWYYKHITQTRLGSDKADGVHMTMGIMGQDCLKRNYL